MSKNVGHPELKAKLLHKVKSGPVHMKAIGPVTGFLWTRIYIERYEPSRKEPDKWETVPANRVRDLADIERCCKAMRKWCEENERG